MYFDCLKNYIDEVKLVNLRSLCLTAVVGQKQNVPNNPTLRLIIQKIKDENRELMLNILYKVKHTIETLMDVEESEIDFDDPVGRYSKGVSQLTIHGYHKREASLSERSFTTFRRVYTLVYKYEQYETYSGYQYREDFEGEHYGCYHVNFDVVVVMGVPVTIKRRRPFRIQRMRTLNAIYNEDMRFQVYEYYINKLYIKTNRIKLRKIRHKLNRRLKYMCIVVIFDNWLDITNVPCQLLKYNI